MELENAVTQYQSNIEKLATKNNVDYEVMLDNWKQKFEEFDNITNRFGFVNEVEELDSSEEHPFIALTINGSIVLASEPGEDGVRKVRYQSIKIRTDGSQNVPEVFEAAMGENAKLNKSIIFVKTMETSFIITIKTADNFNWDDFEETADVMTQEFTKKFELIDQETITKQLDDF
ncbi:MAG: hypothetical protein MJB14_13675 [Spirochaetes bacterium]|nr:hypothetical protein [Spirochaetota bacterium]